MATVTMPLTGEQVFQTWYSSGNNYQLLGNVTSGSITTITTNAIWGAWAGGLGVSPIASTGDTVFVTWYGQLYQTVVMSGGDVAVEDTRTDEQRAADEEQFRAVAARLLQERQQQAKVYEEEQERQKVAAEKAKTLLRRFLTEAQCEELEKSSSFELEVNGKLYRIRPGSRVERLTKDKKVASYFCIHPEGKYGLPPHDIALSQKLLLEADEMQFLQIANETRLINVA